MMMIQWYAVQLLLLSVWLYYWFHSMFFVHFVRRCELEALFLINWDFLKKLFILNFDWRRPFRQYDFPNNRYRLDQSRLSIKYLSDKQSLSHTFRSLEYLYLTQTTLVHLITSSIRMQWLGCRRTVWTNWTCHLMWMLWIRGTLNQSQLSLVMTVIRSSQMTIRYQVKPRIQTQKLCYHFSLK